MLLMQKLPASWACDAAPTEKSWVTVTEWERAEEDMLKGLACREGALAHEGSANLILPSGFVRMIEDAFSKLFDELNRRTTNIAVDLHRQLLLKSRPDCLSLRSDYTCLVCLRRRAQYGLPCGHCISENCVCVFGRKNDHDPCKALRRRQLLFLWINHVGGGCEDPAQDSRHSGLDLGRRRCQWPGSHFAILADSAR